MRTSTESRTVTKTGFSPSKKARILMLALAPVAALMAGNAVAATQTWDPAQTGGSDGSGAWDLSSLDWTGGAWVNGNSAIFGSGGAAGTVTIASPGVSAAGITFNLGYTIAGPGNLTLTGPVSVVSGQTATMNAPIVGTGAVNLTGGGSLVLGGANTYSGGTSISSGTLVVNTGGTAGAATNALLLGDAGGTLTTAAAAVFNTNATVGSFNDTTQTATNSLQVASGQILTVTGNFTVGQVGNNPTTNQTLNTGTAGAGTGGELDVNGNMTIGTNPGGGTKITATVDLSNLSTFKLNNPTGTLNVASGTNIKGNLTLASGANANNFINVASITLQASGSGNANGGGAINLGSGNNTIQASTINLGSGKSNGNLQFVSGAPATATVNISGTGGGTARANITLDNETSGTGNGPSSLLFAGHIANVLANTLTVGSLAGSGAGSANGTVTFDTGTFDVNNLLISVDASGSNANVAVSLGAKGLFTLGTSTASTGVLNVNTSFVLATATNTGAGAVSTSNGTFTMNGGTANINSDITINKANNTTGTLTAALTLNGGTLNMMGHAIGSVALPVTTVSLANTAGQAATLQNLGGTGINGAGLNANGAGSLILVGTNSYTGGTTVTTTLQIGSATQAGSLPTGDVTDNGVLTFAGAGTSNIGNLSGSGSVAINAGTVRVANASGLSGTVNLNAGGTLTPGTSAADVTSAVSIPNLTVSGGTLLFNLDTTTTSSISAGTATFTGTPSFAFNIQGSPVNGQQFTVLTAASLNDGGFLTGLTPVSLGRTTFTPAEVGGNSIVVTVAGGPASLVWNGGADGTTWDTRNGASGTQNWLNGASQDYFFTGDNVTFNDANGGHYNVTISGNVAPGSLKVNSANTYTFGGTGAITGATDITKNGPGTLILANTGTNTYSGGTNIHQGTIVVGAAGALAANTALSFGDGSGNSGTLDLGGNNASVSSITENGGSNVIGNSGSATSTLTFNGGSSNSTFNGVIKDVLGAGSGKVALNVGSGTLLLGGANTYSGGTTVASTGTLTINTGGSISAAGTLTNNGTTNLANAATSLATLNGASTGVLNLNGSNLTITAGGNYAGAINDGSASATLTVPSGSLVLSGVGNFTGNTLIQSGALVQANHSDSGTAPTKTSLGSASAGNVTIASGATLDIGGNSTANGLNFGAKTFFVSGTGITGAGAIINSTAAGQDAAFNNITLQGDTTFSGSRFDIGRINSGDVLDLAGHTLTTNMSGTQPIFAILGNTTAGVTPLAVTAGQIVVNTGGLDIERNASVPADGSSLITFNTGTTLELFQNDGTSLTRPLIFNGNNTIGSGSTTLATLGANSTLKGNITFEANGSGALSLTALNPLTVTGNIVESGTSASVTKAGLATLNLGNSTVAPVNNWTGGTIHQEGLLVLNGNTALPVGTALTMGQATTAATLDLNGSNTTVGSLALGTGAAAISGVFANLSPISTNTTTLTFTTLPAGAVPGALITGTGIPAGDFITAVSTSAKTVTLAVANTNAANTSLTGVTILSNVIGSGSTTANSTLTYTTGTSSFGGVIVDSIGNGTQAVALNVASGNLTLTNANSYSGGTSISGTLIAGNVSALGKGNVAIHNGGKLQLQAGLPSAVTLPGLTIDPTGALDITKDKAIVNDGITHATTLATLQGQAHSQITASGLPAYYGVAVLDNAVLGKTTFGGIGVDATSILIAPELLGDANVDGTVDSTDLNTILNNFGSSTLAWTSGNFDGSATIDLTDLAAVLNNFGRSTSADGITPSIAVATPEPTSLALVGLGAVALLTRRRKA